MFKSFKTYDGFDANDSKTVVWVTSLTDFGDDRFLSFVGEIRDTTAEEAIRFVFDKDYVVFASEENAKKWVEEMLPLYSLAELREAHKTGFEAALKSVAKIASQTNQIMIDDRHSSFKNFKINHSKPLPE